MTVRGKLLAAAFLTTVGAGSAMARDFDFDGPKFQKINVCTPHKMIIEDISSEIDALSSENFQRRIEQLDRELEQRRALISSLEDDKSQALTRKEGQERRLEQLTNNMPRIVAGIQRKVDDAKRKAVQAKSDIAYNEKEKSQCKGGMLGTFCRKKYRGRIEEAQDKLQQAKRTRAQLEKEIASLPNEKKALPAKIAKHRKNIVALTARLKEVKGMTPSVSKLQDKIDILVQKKRNQDQELVQLNRGLNKARKGFEKCDNQRFLAKTYSVVMEQAENFKKNPQLCDNVDYLVQVASKEHVKKGIRDASFLVCDLAQGHTPGDDQGGPISGDDRDDFVQYLDTVITSPLMANGQYPNNFRSANYEPKKVDEVGGSDVRMIKFKVTFDIEQSYDYLLIKDASGNEVERIDGQGEMDVEVASSAAQFFFYSDGRSGGKGFKIENIELHK